MASSSQAPPPHSGTRQRLGRASGVATIVESFVRERGGPGTLTVRDGRAGGGDWVSWAELHLRARRMASVLAAAGIGRGSRVGLLGDTSIGLATALQAVWLSGAAVTVLPRSSRRGGWDRLRSIITDAGLDQVVVDGALVAEAAGSLATPVASLPELRHRALSAPPAAARTPDPADLAMLQYTSGSTRIPCGVPVTHGHLAVHLVALREMLEHEHRHPQPMLSWLPLYHDMGLIGFLALPMSCGCPLVLQPPGGFALRPGSWLEALSRHRSAVTGAPDFAYRLVTPLLEAGMDADLSALRFLISGGEPIGATAMDRFIAAATRHGLDPRAVLPAYGLAEATLAVSSAPAGAGLTTDPVDPEVLERHGRAVPARPGGRVRTLTRLGRPVRATRVRVVDPRTRAPVGERQVGEVEVQGASVVGHYWGEPAAPAGTWLPTGDLGYLADGDLVLCGRRKDVLFAGGRNIYPPDVEAAAGDVPGVRPGGAVAFGIPGEDDDRLVVAVEARGGDRTALCRAVASAVVEETGLRPTDVIGLPPGRLPRTTSGKLRRTEARGRYLAGELTATRQKGDGHADQGTRRAGRPAAGVVAAGARGAA